MSFSSYIVLYVLATPLELFLSLLVVFRGLVDLLSSLLLKTSNRLGGEREREGGKGG